MRDLKGRINITPLVLKGLVVNDCEFVNLRTKNNVQ